MIRGAWGERFPVGERSGRAIIGYRHALCIGDMPEDRALGVGSVAHGGFDRGAGLALSIPQVVLKLCPQPHFRITAQPLGKPDCHIRADGGTAIDDSGQCRPRHTKLLRRFGHG